MTITSATQVQTVMVAGSGVLGAQIALQCAVFGKTVHLYDISDDALAHAEKVLDIIAPKVVADTSFTTSLVDQARDRITMTTQLDEATAGVQLVIEAVPESTDIKDEFYSQLAEHLDEDTILCTNTSTLAPSTFAQHTGRPEKFLALHFANEIWKNNTGEVMGHAGTDPAIFDIVVQFAEDIGLVPLPLHKEWPGYILNTLLVPLLNASLRLLVEGVSDAPTIDLTWRTASHSPLGPLQILDRVGIPTAYHIISTRGKQGDEESAKIAAFLKENYLDTGRTGLNAGHGFYDYDEKGHQL
ncbi:putative 3-hydroxybutyryl-CoA dehydrogenase [Corynebacterium ciconiae DSM 44920]|uniref:3-hydroxyacyl-CoA dehydrogenase n=1 Tax=Corynebacterium ciconiae TaxID=227319 RepID=UPI0003816D76|nr:3-hydroxyacyl-CoA dehydrogenase [Corynebacterium ciconiae]WKD60697.1 putative 3-hydroxybutyryl-CoA dehydrogenase [Corynebacterium ciconiae DSM 44920]